MKSRGILFSAPMVRALLAGAKMQTRRVVNPQPPPKCVVRTFVEESNDPWCHRAFAWYDQLPLPMQQHYARCPYGLPGDRLWVRETWQTVFDGCPYGCECWSECCCIERAHAEHGTPANGCQHASIAYRATDTGVREVMGDDGEAVPMHWRPSIFMPRWASRIELLVTQVRAQRLHDISDDDARAEGCGGRDEFGRAHCFLQSRNLEPSPRAHFIDVWERINGADVDRCWATNPWVWVVSFERVQPAAAPSDGIAVPGRSDT